MADFRIGANIVIGVNQAAFKSFLKNVRQLRIDFLGLEQAALVLGRVGKALTSVGRAMTGAFSGVIAPAAEFDGTMTRLQAVSGKTAGEVTVLSDRFLEMSSVLPLSAQQLGEVGVEAVKAGVRTQVAIESIALAASQLAAVSADLSEASAAKGIIAISRQFGVSADDMAGNAVRLGDAIAALKDAGIGTAGEIVNVTKRFGAMARAAGLTQEQALALAATTRSLGIQTEVSGTALSQLLTRMAADTGRFARVAKINEAELRGLIDSGQGFAAMQKFLNAVTDRGTVKTTELGKRLSDLGIRGQRPISVILGLAQNMGELNRIVGISERTQGRLGTQFGIFSQGFDQQIKTFRGSVENLKIAFGQVLKPVIVAFIQVLLPVIDLLTRLPGPIKLLIIVLTVLAGAFLLVTGGIISLAAMLITGAASMTFLIQTYRAFIASSNVASASIARQAAMTNTLAGTNLRAAASTTALARANIGLAASNAAGMGGFLVRLKNLPMALFGAVGGLAGLKAALLVGLAPLIKIIAIVALVIVVLVALKSHIEFVANAFVEMLRPIGTLLKGLAGLFAVFDPGGGNSLTGALFFFVQVVLWKTVLFLRILGVTFRVVGAILEGIVAAILDGLAGIKPIMDRVRLVVANIVEGFTLLGKRLGLVSENGSLFQSILNGIKTVVIVLLKPITWLLQLLVWIGGVLVGALVGVVEGVLRALTPVFGTIIEIRDELVSAWQEIAIAFEPISAAFSELFDAIFGGSEGFDAFGIAVQAFAFITRLAISPLILLIRILAVAVKGIVFLFTGLGKLIIPVLKKVADFLVPIIKLMTLWFRTTNQQRSVFAVISDKIKFFFESLGNTVGTVVSKITSFFDNVAEGIRGAFLALRTKIDEAFSGILAPLRNVLNRARTGINAMIAGFNALPGSNIKPLAPISFDTGGKVSKTGIAVVHRGEVIGSTSQMSSFAGKASMPGVNITAPRPAPAPSPSPAVSGDGGGASITLTIPVKVMLNDMVLGEAVARVTEDEVRRAFGTRGVRLAGLG